MAPMFDQISKIHMNRESIRLMVRVVRMWKMPMYSNPSQTSSLELILVDEHGGKIQATVRKALLYKFESVFEEGNVYRMVYFSVLPNSGNYRATYHEYKLVFLYKTTVVRKESDVIPRHVLNFVPFNEVLGLGDNYEHLIDVIGVLTAAPPEKQYVKDGKLTTMVVLELTDPYGKLECALFGEYVDEVKNFVLSGQHVQTIVVMQLARVKTFKGKIVIQNSMTATKLMFNPDIPEAITFRNGIAEHGVIEVEPLSMILPNSKEGLEFEFIKQHAKRSISQLCDVKENGMFIVVGRIVDIVYDGSWFYLACKCNRSVSMKKGVHYCDNCHVPVLQLSPRFKLKVEVTDDKKTSVFVLFDRDVNLLINMTCEQLLAQTFQELDDDGYPMVFDTLIGKRFLFKVENKLHQNIHFEGSYPVRRVCDDEDVISTFDIEGGEITPAKVMIVPPFPSMSTEIDVDASYNVGCNSVVPAISLGDNDCSQVLKWSSGKRKLEDEFEMCITETSEIVAAKCSRPIEIGDDANDYEPAYPLVPVKIEKE